MKIPKIRLPELRLKHSSEINKIVEIQHRAKFRNILLDASKVKKEVVSEVVSKGVPQSDFYHGLSKDDLMKTIDGGLLTFLLHW